jgi:hypothetical protein
MLSVTCHHRSASHDVVQGTEPIICRSAPAFPLAADAQVVAQKRWGNGPLPAAPGELIRSVQDGTRQAVDSMSAGTASVERGVAQAEQAGDSLARILEAVTTTVTQIGRVA